MTYQIQTLQTTTRTVSGLNGPETITDTPAAPVNTIYREGNTCLVAGSGNATMAEVEAAMPGIRAWKERYFRDLGNERLMSIARPYQDGERETWPYQREECIAYSLDSSALTPYCDTVAALRGIPREIFLAKVKENMDLFSQASAAILGRQQALIDRAYAEQDLSVFVNMGWPE